MTDGSVVYPLGFDDPAGLQSQQSLSLLPALSALPSGSFSDAVNLEIQELDSRRQSGKRYVTSAEIWQDNLLDLHIYICCKDFAAWQVLKGSAVCKKASTFGFMLTSLSSCCPGRCL